MAKRNQPQAAPAKQEILETSQEPGQPVVNPETPATDPEELEQPEDDPEPEAKRDETFDRAWLEGLLWHGARRLPGGGNRYEAVQRKAQAFDVLSWRRLGDVVVIVLSDGSKHTVEV